MRIGVDLGGTKIEGIILDDEGSIRENIRIKTPYDQYDATLEATCEIVNKLQAKA
jgi:fructokinase